MAGALDIIQVIVEAAILGQRILSVYEFVSTQNILDEDAKEDLRTHLQDTVYPTILPSLADELEMQSLYFKNLTDNLDLGQLAWTGDQPTSTGEPLPLGVAGLIVAPTALPKTRGRKFIAGVTEGSCNGSLWDSSLVTAMTNFGAAYISAFLGASNDDPWQPGVSDKNGVFRPFIEALVTNIPAYQRRRKQGVGE